MDCLNVYLCGRLAGFLERDVKTVTFRYSPDYLSDPESTVISSTLPLSADRYAERDVMAFFSNLLPDEGVRRRIAEILRLSPDDTFGLPIRLNARLYPFAPASRNFLIKSMPNILLKSITTLQ